MAEEEKKEEEKPKAPAGAARSFGDNYFTERGFEIANSSSKPTSREEAIDAATGEINAGIEAAIASNEAGAAAVIEASKIAAKAILDAAQLGIDAQERFFAIADKKLTPFVEQGYIAQDELASMIGIPNSEGKIVPYDLDKLRQTPGYQFVFDETVEGVLRSAIGNKLSSGTREEIENRSAGLASQTFNDRVTTLSSVADRGAQSGAALGQIAANFGGNIGQIASASGGQQAQVFMNQGNQLADLFNSTAMLQRDLGSTLAELELVRGKVSPFSGGSGGGGGFNSGGAIAGAAAGFKIGGPVGAAIGGGVGGFL